MAARSWGLAPSEFWGMTISELVAEIMSMEGSETYAGGMTSGDIEGIKEESAALRKQMSDKKV